MTEVATEDVADYYDQQANQYLDVVRYKRAHKRATSARELAFVKKHAKPGGKVLEIGAGPGYFTRELVKQSDSVMAIDVSSEMVETLEKNVSAPNLSTRHLDLFDLQQVPGYGTYDTVICMRVLPHVDDVDLALSTIRGAIVGQGNVVFDLLNDSSYYHFVLKVLRRGFPPTKYHSVRSMREMIDRAGFEINDSFGRGYPWIGGLTLDRIGYSIMPSLAFGVCFNVTVNG